MNISKSNIRVLNTGTIGTIDGAIGALERGGDLKPAQALKTIIEAIASSSDLPYEEKKKALELLTVVASEGVAPKAKRRSHVIRSLIRDVSSILSGSAVLVKIWEATKPVIEALF